jgi:hypothetical protein
MLATRWRRGADAGAALVMDREGHGRDERGSGLDITRTVGCLTTRHSVRLQLGAGAGRGARAAGPPSRTSNAWNSCIARPRPPSRLRDEVRVCTS